MSHFVSSNSSILEGWQGCDAKEGGVGMDGGDGWWSTRGIPPCYLLMILTNPHPPCNKQQQRRKTAAYKLFGYRKNLKKENIVDFLGQQQPRRRRMMAIMVLWCLCAHPCTLLTLTPLSLLPLNHIRLSSPPSNLSHVIPSSQHKGKSSILAKHLS